MATDMKHNESSRSEEDSHDHIGSPTPSGAATPRPDLSDKRLPGIMHGYFGQVRDSSTSTSTTLGHCTYATPAQDMGNESYPSEYPRRRTGPASTLLTAPSSPGREEHDPLDRALPLLPHERLGGASLGALSGNLQTSGYPTPPSSSPPSFTEKENKRAVCGSNSTRLVNGSVAGRPTFGRHESATDVIPLRTRRHFPGPKSLSGIITNSPVHAAHISNPTSTRSSTAPSTPLYETPEISAFSSLTSTYHELSKLTDSVAASPRLKNTPPHTPRALSSERIDNALRPSSLGPKVTHSSPEESVAQPSQQETPKTSASNSHSSATGTPPVGPPKGKLLVQIFNARGLRPSYDPYVVCVFEWNEYISRGPKREDLDVEGGDNKGRDDGIGGVPIKRSGSDMGRPMAIPMKSRQSSTTSLSDQKNFKAGRQVTDPQWDHEATLYV